MSAPTGNNLDIRAWEKQLKRSLDFLDRRFPEDYGHAVLMFLCSGEAPIHCAINLQRADRRQQAEQYIRWYGSPIDRRDIYLGVANYAVAPSGKAGATRTKAMVGHVRALYCERDEAMLGAELPKPSYTIATSLSRFQDYWELDQPISGADAEPYLRRIAAACGLGNQAVDCARVLRLPGTQNFKPDRNGEIVTVVHDNNIVYTLEDFAHLPQVATGHASRSASNGASDERKIPEGARHTELVRAAGSMRHYGIGKEHIYEALAEMNAEQCVPPLEDDEVRRIADSANWKPEPPPAIRKSKATNGTHPDDHEQGKATDDADSSAVPTKEHADNHPMIDAGNHDLPDVTRQAWAALAAANDPPALFHHGGLPSRLQYGEDGRILLVPLNEHRLRCEVAEAAEWYVTKGKEQIVVSAVPPLDVIQNMLAQAELPLPVLRSITETPVFAPDARLIEAAGFDAASGIYVQPAPGLIVPPVPDTPTADDVAKARALICDDLLPDFPFTEQADRAAAVALFLLPFARAMIPGLTPMHGIESPTVGSGKGLLGDVLVRPAFGQHGGMIAEARDDDEWRKRVGAKLREGAPIIHIDNVTRPLDSGALAMALTAPVFSDRVLGQTATFRATVRNVWMFTANNPVMSLEIARRTVRIRIDTNQEKPWQRDTFKHQNLRAWADTHRGDLIHAALTLVRAWIVAGKPMADVTLGSYEEWAGTMGGILDVAGVTGFLDNLSAFYEAADVEGAAWRQFVALWAEAHGSNKVGVGDLFTLALDVDGLNFGKGGDRSQRVSFGSQLTRQRDRIYDGYRITLAGTLRNAKQWRLLPVKPAGGESQEQRFTHDFSAIATESDECVNLGESFPTPRARKNDEDISVEDRGGKIHLDSHRPAFSLTPEGKTVVNLHLGDSPEGERPLAADDLPDRVALRQGAAVCGDKATTVTEDVRRAAQRIGFAFDSFAPVAAEAARLERFLEEFAGGLR